MASALSNDIAILEREHALGGLQTAGYKPTRLEHGPLTQLGGPMYQANIADDDHPPELRWTNRNDKVAVESVYSFMLVRDAVLRPLQVRL